ncbi:NAD(P)-dependent oxidoreductase [Flavobacterium silvaticum]|uniref:Saccharopine dehydrogenase [NAD(+), L-lysine-forming] n=1 Tax=Flavobacterium silvaticum TaxID=1852020 RepID=A0A972JI58_9FLAO|nr:NAD(P)-dependent oxidoreductase [Flavobacterium silvaticum]NMH26967.1 alanine dehydrogenase [Flavobacterium silvaticum]
MKIGIIRERKNPPDRRVVFSPEALAALKKRYPDADVTVESSDIRVFSDDEYRKAGIEVTTDMNDRDFLIGVKEVPVENLIPGKKYFFFSHTIKEQPHNQKLLKAILEKNIDLFDHETIVDAKFARLIGFGRYAGIVGAYNGIRAFGLKYELFDLPKAETLRDQDELVSRLKRVMLPPIKIVVTGHGKVGSGVKQILDAIGIKQIQPTDFLSKNYSSPVYTQLDVLDYNKRIDGEIRDNQDFYKHPEAYVSDFERFSQAADVYMAGHFYGNGAPIILTAAMLASPKNKLKVIADISCDVDGPIASTLRSSTIADPLYGYHPVKLTEVEWHHPAAVTVMAVDNLPCELPRDASRGFGEMFLEHVVPAFFNSDADGILERAQITSKGTLMPRFRYLSDYAGLTEKV